jgi:hypothetical protein
MPPPLRYLLSRESPRDPAGWPDVKQLPVPRFQMDMVQMGRALSIPGKTAGSGMLEHARQSGLAIPPELTDPDAQPSTEQTLTALRTPIPLAICLSPTVAIVLPSRR